MEITDKQRLDFLIYFDLIVICISGGSWSVMHKDNEKIISESRSSRKAIDKAMKELEWK